MVQGRFHIFLGWEELDRERVTILQKVDVMLELQKNINCKAVRTKGKSFCFVRLTKVTAAEMTFLGSVKLFGLGLSF